MRYKPYSNLYKVNLSKLKLYSNLSFKSNTQRTNNTTFNHRNVNNNQKSFNTSTSFTNRGNSNLTFRGLNSFNRDQYNFKIPMLANNIDKNKTINKSLLIVNNLLNKNNNKISLTKQYNNKLFLKKDSNPIILIKKKPTNKPINKNKTINVDSHMQLYQEEDYPKNKTINIDQWSNEKPLVRNDVSITHDDEGGELSLDEVQDIIKCFTFKGISGNCNLFYKEDYLNYISAGKDKYLKYFFT